MEDFLISIYELFVDGSLLDDLIKEGLVMPLSLSSLLIPLLGVAAFYYVINSVRFYKKRHWGLTMLISALIVFIVNLSTCISMAGKQIPKDPDNEAAGFLFDEGDSVFFMFGLQMFVGACLLFFIFSIILKWWSTNCRKTPF
jgi:hypothetical protein